MATTFDIITALSCTAVSVATLAYWSLPRGQYRPVSKGAEKRAGKMARDWETDAVCDEEETGVGEGEVKVRLAVGGVARKEVPTLERSKLVRRAAAHVRAKVGLLKRNAANSMVVRKLVCEFLDDIKDLRKTHYLAIVPYAVELSFVPTFYDIDARDMAATADWTGRREQHDAERVVEVGRGLFRLFGRRVVRTMPPTT